MRVPNLKSPISNRKSLLGFTLVEMLVVIAIIGILVAILVPTVMRAVSTAQDAALALELDRLSQAIIAYELDHKDFPPDFSNQTAVVAHVRRAFPRNTQNISVWLGGGGSRIDPAEALVVWLSALRTDPRDPLGISSSTGERKVYFEFDETRLRDADGDGFNEYYPKYGNDAPYVYFDGRIIDDPGNSQPVCAYAWATYPLIAGQLANVGRSVAIPGAITPTTSAPYTSSIGVVRPYRSNSTIKTTDLSTWPISTTGNGTEWQDAAKFQIICAGQDNHFGWDDVAASGLVFKRFPDPSYYANTAILRENDLDNIPSFSDGRTVGDSIP